jgi:hypothetical protein
MSEPEEQEEPTEPTVTDVPEPDQPDADEDEEAAEEEPEPEPETEPEAAEGPRDDREIEKAYKAVQKENTRHNNRVSEIMGEDAQALVPCELCSHFVAGFRLAQVPPPEIVGRVRAAIGLPERENLRESPYHLRCETCGGLGELLTHSFVTNQETVTCPDCQAKGFVLDPGAPSPVSYFDYTTSASTWPNGETTGASVHGLDPAEVKRRMELAVAQAQGHAVGPQTESRS